MGNNNLTELANRYEKALAGSSFLLGAESMEHMFSVFADTNSDPELKSRQLYTFEEMVGSTPDSILETISSNSMIDSTKVDKLITDLWTRHDAEGLDAMLQDLVDDYKMPDLMELPGA